MRILNRGQLMSHIIDGYDVEGSGKIATLLGRLHVEAALADDCDADGWLWSRGVGTGVGESLVLRCYDRWTGTFTDHDVDGDLCINKSGTRNCAIMLLTPKDQGLTEEEKAACLRGGAMLL